MERDPLLKRACGAPSHLPLVLEVNPDRAREKSFVDWISRDRSLGFDPLFVPSGPYRGDAFPPRPILISLQ